MMDGDSYGGVQGTKFQSDPDNLVLTVVFDRDGKEIARSTEDEPQLWSLPDTYDPRGIGKVVLHFSDGSVLELPGMPLS